MFEEKSLFEIDAEEAKLECQWCGEEVPEDELYHGVCFSCIENYYEPELARQFLEEAGLEAYFYVMDYMRTDYNTIDILRLLAEQRRCHLTDRSKIYLLTA